MSDSAPNKDPRVAALVRESITLIDEISCMDLEIAAALSAHNRQLERRTEEWFQSNPAAKWTRDFIVDQGIDKLFEVILKMLAERRILKATWPAAIAVNVATEVFSPIQGPDQKLAYLDNHSNVAKGYYGKKVRLEKVFQELSLTVPPSVQLDLLTNKPGLRFVRPR